jgi:glycosyltransferase involved in cell wall biosynthesis
MHIAVCIPTFNQADHVGGAIESALDQTGVSTEVWVSDDASTDATGQVLARFAGHPRVHLHRQPVNTGIGFNAGWVMSQPVTDFIVRLDSDDRLHPGYCLDMARLLEAEPRAAVVHGAANQVDERGRRVRVRRLARRSGFQNGETALREAATGYKVAANVCMFRASALRDLSFLSEEGHDFGEDWALFARLADAGWGNIYRTAVAAVRLPLPLSTRVQQHHQMEIGIGKADEGEGRQLFGHDAQLLIQLAHQGGFRRFAIIL